MHYMTALSESTPVKNVDVFFFPSLPFFIVIFSENRLDFQDKTMLYSAQIIDALWDPSQLLHLTRGYIALHYIVVRIKIG